MPKEIKFRFPIDDTEMLMDCKKTFGEQTKIMREGTITGFELIFVAIIPTVGVSIALIDFILNHFVKNNDSRVEEERKRKRKVEILDICIPLYDCEKDEVKEILIRLLEEIENENNDSRT